MKDIVISPMASGGRKIIVNIAYPFILYFLIILGIPDFHHDSSPR
jgi:hypothetical protein